VIALPASLLALAFAAVGVSAWLLGRHMGDRRTVRLPRDYYVGLDHLINDRFDHAVEVFARMAEAGDAAEIQFALGSLFRRRGEVDRAIGVHTRLREQGDAGLRAKATFALALDYLSAGLMDRAELLFQELAASSEYRHTALDQLLRIYEAQGDWHNALQTLQALPTHVQSERGRIAAHYLCELAEQALAQGETERARSLLRQARARARDLPRAQMLAARIAESGGARAEALEAYLQILAAHPALTIEIIPRALALAEAGQQTDVLAALWVRLQRCGEINPRQQAWLLASALPPAQLQLLAAAQEPQAAPAIEAYSLALLLKRLGDGGGRYQCAECGLLSAGWRCPKCRTWDSMRPAAFKWDVGPEPPAAQARPTMRHARDEARNLG
jgi:lipopolysaccharide biosynthesis regulator YciM